MLVTARAIPNGDETAWHREWKATAERVEELGRTSLAAGHLVSAREALLRASNYYRTAEFYRREDPWHDPEVTLLSTRSRETFQTAIPLFGFGFEQISIPYEQTTLPGYLYLVDDSGQPRPAVVYNSGYDSSVNTKLRWEIRNGMWVMGVDQGQAACAVRQSRLSKSTQVPSPNYPRSATQTSALSGRPSARSQGIGTT